MDYSIGRLQMSSVLCFTVYQTIYRINHLFQNGRALLKCRIFILLQLKYKLYVAVVADSWHFGADPYLRLTDPTPDPRIRVPLINRSLDPDPDIFVSDFQDGNKNYLFFASYWQCCGSMTYWCGSGSVECVSMPLTNGFGSGSCYFRHWPPRGQQKTNFVKKSFSNDYFFNVYLHHFSKIKSKKEVRKQ
jgi:hypothetical protein